MKENIERFLYNNRFIVIINSKIVYLDVDIPVNITLSRKVEYKDIKIHINNNIEIIKIQLCRTRIKNYICGILIKGENLNKEIIIKYYNQILEAVKMVM
ncbi:MAG: hypothetical protein QXV69_00700 [Sulfolobaceae archaeon]